jgi:hypothetical protein
VKYKTEETCELQGTSTIDRINKQLQGMGAMEAPVADQKELLTKRLTALLKKSENKTCSDCSDKRNTYGALIKAPTDAPLGSKTLVVFVCFNCAGAHRQLGTAFSLVRSVTFDDCK